MHFDFSFEQRTLAESVAKILKSFPPVTQAAPYPYDAGQPMKALAALGLFGEGEEGSPLGHTDAVAVAMEAGRTIVAAPVVEALAVAVALSGSRPDIASRLAAGEVPGVAVSGGIERIGGELSGEAIVPHGAAAGFLLLPVAGEGARDWILVEPGDVEAAPVETTDITSGAARLKISGLPAPAAGNGADGMDRALRLFALAEIVGAADACLERTVAYISERKQFGKPIGSNQAVKHMAADCAVSLEAMKAAVEYAGWALDEAQEDTAAAEEASLALLSAASYVGEHGRRVAERCVQMHGGIAFTWDYGLHLPLRRILFRTATLARMRDGREGLAAHLLD
ncbi:acyl-CoA dehydrogenase family protein [Aquibium sp. LZ166]|uniref:Acyl-CoA dehydrogenase family protein n=1 Tax=Aquibium pacificus TaxID=3153579 RepID=A0ABV3SNA3_9HYPH